MPSEVWTIRLMGHLRLDLPPGDDDPSPWFDEGRDLIMARAKWHLAVNVLKDANLKGAMDVMTADASTRCTAGRTSSRARAKCRPGTADMAAIKFPAFAPDVASVDAGVASVATNVLPRADGYGPVASPSSISAALPADCRGAIEVQSPAFGFPVYFAGTGTKLFKFNLSSAAWDDVTPVGRDLRRATGRLLVVRGLRHAPRRDLPRRPPAGH